MQLLLEKNRHSLDHDSSSIIDQTRKVTALHDSNIIRARKASALHFRAGKDRDMAKSIRRMCASLTRKENKVFHVYDAPEDHDSTEPTSLKTSLKTSLPNKIILQPIHSGIVILAKGDSIECVRRFLRKKRTPRLMSHKCLVLNYANSITPGGGWSHGATAQEEMLFYRSNYFQSLEAAKQTLSKTAGGQYITPLTRCIISPNVYVWGVFHEKEKTIDLTPHPETDMILPMIAAAAVDHRDDGKIMGDQVYEEMSQLWESIFQAAIRVDIDHFFIGPIGCGVFAPRVKTDHYKKKAALALADKIQQYHKYFQSIIFCDYVPNGKYDDPSSNYTIFGQVLTEHVSNIACDYCDDPTCKNLE